MEAAMKCTSRDQIDYLIELQQKEEAAAALESQLKQLPRQLQILDERLSEYEQAVSSHRKIVEDLKKTYRELDAEMQVNQGRIKKRREQLDAVKTNKEYQALLKDIEEIKKVNSRTEDKAIECMDQMETAEDIVRKKEKDFALAREAADREKQDLSARADEQQEELTELISGKDSIRLKIVPELLEQYDFIKSQVGGTTVIAEARDAVCLGCHMNIPPQMYNELHRENEIRICPHCHRMLYVVY